MGDGKVGHRCIARHLLGEFDALGQTGAGGNEIVRDADRLTFFGAVAAAGEHHVRHPRGADEARQANRAAAADEDAAAAFR